jgi:dihydrofolate synthase/folylpolyglutamate synthase
MVDAQQEDQGQPGLTFFEVLTCLAFAAFADAPVDVAVVEVGLGGRWDATNVADGRVNVITPVAVDHAAWLGDTPTQIAEEKSHIIKAHSVAVLAQQTPEVRRILLDRCTQVSARAYCYGDDFALSSRAVAVGGQVIALQGLSGFYDDVFLPLMGRHQGENAAVAVAAVEALLTGGQPLDRAIVDALGSVVSPGRLELVAREPAVLVDAAHNPAGIDALASALSDSYHFTDVVVVLSTMADKDLKGILAGLGSVASVLVVTRNSSPRAAAAQSVAALAGEMYGEGRVVVERDFDAAMAMAVSLAAERGGAVLATGSVVTAADAARWAVERGADG